MIATVPCFIGAFQCNNVEIVSRAEWNASEPKGTTNFTGNKPYATIHHTAMARCFDLAACKRQIKVIQDFHQNNRSWWDIGYNFLIGEDGRVYEGRGWYSKGAHAGLPFNNLAYGISIMGNFMTFLPDKKALDAFKNLVQCGIDNGRIQSNYSLIGHRQANEPGYTVCPGTALYCHVQTWEHFERYQQDGTFDNATCANIPTGSANHKTYSIYLLLSGLFAHILQTTLTDFL
ncbi:unnamed protein product [Owenia fusiformis]|nr:unnamed protein product [Owenia fusiformis]